jgi:hypothetical protein
MELCGFPDLALRCRRHPVVVSERNLAMTTILVLNAVSSLVALLGVAGFFALRGRRARHRPAVQVLYVTRVNPPKLPRR